MTDSEVARCVAILMAAYNDKSMPEQTAMVYEEALRDLPYAHVERAVKRLILTSKWMPRIAEIREAAVAERDGVARNGVDAWGDVRRAVSKFGINRTPVFEDPLVARAVAVLGWREICNAPEYDPSTRARFIEHYDKSATSMERDRRVAGVLPPVASIDRTLPGMGQQARLLAAKVAHALDAKVDAPPPWTDEPDWSDDYDPDDPSLLKRRR